MRERNAHPSQRFQPRTAQPRPRYAHKPRAVSLIVQARATLRVLFFRVAEARTLVSEILAAEPSYGLERYAKFHYFKNPEHLERILSALRDAGMPE